LTSALLTFDMDGHGRGSQIELFALLVKSS
jgi:hypothetical protein